MLARLEARQAGETENRSAAAPGDPAAAMVGQVNGRPVYAQDVLEPRDAQLRALAQQLPRAEFRLRAQEIITLRLQEIVTNALVYGEAQRDLNEQERAGLRQMLVNRREEMIRKHGLGSLALADETLLREQGKTVDQLVEDYRQEVVVRRYFQQRVLPKLNVTRRDVERYYYNNLAEFQPPRRFTVRLIRQFSEEQAQQIVRKLEAGASFHEIAASLPESWKPGEAGLLAQNVSLSGVREGVLRDTAQQLSEGEHSQPFSYNDAWWIMRVEDVTEPQNVSLPEAQLEIEQKLRAAQYSALEGQLRQELIRTGSFNPVDEMARDLLEIAMNRYAPAG
jgi:hypothetical protein